MGTKITINNRDNYLDDHQFDDTLSKWPLDWELVSKWSFLVKSVTLMTIPSNFIQFYRMSGILVNKGMKKTFLVSK